MSMTVGGENPAMLPAVDPRVMNERVQFVWIQVDSTWDSHTLPEMRPKAERANECMEE
jgi:hypothetical protein